MPPLELQTRLGRNFYDAASLAHPLFGVKLYMSNTECPTLFDILGLLPLVERAEQRELIRLAICVQVGGYNLSDNITLCVCLLNRFAQFIYRVGEIRAVNSFNNLCLHFPHLLTFDS